MLHQLVKFDFVDTKKILAQRVRCADVENIDKWDKKLVEIDQTMPVKKLQSQFESLHFELDVIDSVLKVEPCAEIIYEPKPLKRNGKNCDIAIIAGGTQYLVECKYFSPESKCKKVEAEFFPSNFTVDLDEETYYHDFTIRSKLLKILSEAENKIDNYKKSHTTVLAVSIGFYVDWARLMFVAYFYKNNVYHPFDYLAKLTNHYINNKRVQYSGTINQFWSCHKKGGSIDSISIINTVNGKKEKLRI